MQALAILVVLFVLLHPATGAAENEDTLSRPVETGYVRSSILPIRRVAPNYPQSALDHGEEGWVMVSYTISTDGDVIEAMIEDSVLHAVRQWKYKPAMLNGEPVEQSMTRTRLVLQLPALRKGATKRFVARFRQIEKLIMDGNIQEAEPLLTDLHDTGRHNLYEDAWYWWLNYRYLKASGNTDYVAKHGSLSKAVGYVENYLAPDVFVVAIQELYNLELQAQDISAAIETYERLVSSKGAKQSTYYNDVHTAMESNVLKLREIVAGDTIMQVTAHVGQFDYWHHHLLRRSFSLGDIRGKLDLVDIRCDKRTQRYTMSETSTWTIPESWGDCRVYIQGEPGSTFTFYELPDSVAAVN